MKMLNDCGYFENSYFTEDELRCKGSGELNLAPGFLGMLIHLRTWVARPLIVTSCCRSKEHNTAVGGHPKSLHLTQNERSINGTMAIDISTTEWSLEVLEEFENDARAAGWSVGIAKTFIHLDARILLGRSRGDFTY
jgi:hypothetical protein